jgi:hypothetical protein
MFFPVTRVALFIDTVKRSISDAVPRNPGKLQRSTSSLDWSQILGGNPRLGSIGNQCELQRSVDAMSTGAPPAIFTPNKMILNHVSNQYR